MHTMTGKELKALRESLGLSRRQVAIILDVSESTVKHCENDIRSNGAYAQGIKLLHDGLTQPDNRVKSGLYADWRTNPKAHLKALKDAVEAERERCAEKVELWIDTGESLQALAADIREGK